MKLYIDFPFDRVYTIASFTKEAAHGGNHGPNLKTGVIGSQAAIDFTAFAPDSAGVFCFPERIAHPPGCSQDRKEA